MRKEAFSKRLRETETQAQGQKKVAVQAKDQVQKAIQEAGTATSHMARDFSEDSDSDNEPAQSTVVWRELVMGCFQHGW